MAIDKKLIHFKTWNNFILQGVGSEENITTPTSGTEEEGTAIYGQIKGTSIVFIKDVGKIWTHGKVYDGSTINVDELQDKLVSGENIKTINGTPILGEGDIEISEYDDTEIREELNNKVDKVSGKQLSTEDFTTDLKTKLEEMDAYHKPDGGIPKSDLDISVQTSLDKGEAAWQFTTYSQIPDNRLEYSSPGCDDISPIDIAISNVHSANRLALCNTDGVTVEYSNDSGSTWNDYNASNEMITGILSGCNPGNFALYIGKREAGEKATVDDQLRITLDPNVMNIYTHAQKMLLNISTDGATQCKVKVDFEFGDNPGVFAEQSIYDINGWSGWNAFPCNCAFGNVHVTKMRLTFFIGGVDPTYDSRLHLIDMYLVGKTYWITPSTLAKTGHLYDYDYNKNAYFPGEVYSNGNKTLTAQDISGKQDTIADLDTIRSGAALGATALQSYTEQYKGTVTGIKVNGSTHNPSNGVVDLGTISADESLRIHFEPNFDLEIGQHIDVTSLVQQSMGITPAELYEEVATNEKKTALFIHETMGGELQEISRVTDPSYEAVGLSYLSTLDGLPSPFQLIISPTQCQLVIVDMLAGYNSVIAPLTEMVEGKQEQLVSGTNIKTINGESILGSGDIEVSYDDPELKVVNHESSDTNVELTPYVTHKWGTISSLTLTFSESTESEYNVVFEASDADFVLSMPQNIRWANSQIPQFEANKQYEINIKGERALYAVFDAPYVEET